MTDHFKRPSNVISFGAPRGPEDFERVPDSAYAADLDLGPEGGDDAGLFTPASDLAGQPIKSRDWLVEGLIPARTVTLLGGDGGTGKSLLALQLAVAVAGNGRWLGRTVTQGGAVYLSAEDDRDELHRRLADIARAEDVRLGDLGRLSLCSRAGEDALLATLQASSGRLVKTGLYQAVDAHMRATRPALLVLDTLADLFPGNENDRTQARQFVGLLRRLAMAHGCAVLMLAHPSLSGLTSGSGTSGSTGWSNSARSRLYLERCIDGDYEANPDARVLRTMKANHGRIGGKIGMTWKDGAFIADPEETGLDRMATGGKAERVFLKLLRSTSEQGVKVNHAGGKNYAPLYFESEPKAEGVKKAAFVAAMKALLDAGQIRIRKEGRPGKERQFLEVAE